MKTLAYAYLLRFALVYSGVSLYAFQYACILIVSLYAPVHYAVLFSLLWCTLLKYPSEQNHMILFCYDRKNFGTYTWNKLFLQIYRFTYIDFQICFLQICFRVIGILCMAVIYFFEDTVGKVLFLRTPKRSSGDVRTQDHCRHEERFNSIGHVSGIDF